MRFKYVLLFLVTLSLLGCGDNPLLGTWHAKSGQSHSFIMCKEIVFTKDTSRCGSMIENVSGTLN